MGYIFNFAVLNGSNPNQIKTAYYDKESII